VTAPPTRDEAGRPPDRPVAVFGYLGLVPFWAPVVFAAGARVAGPLSLVLLAPVSASWALTLQRVYAALILSFLGGARFGRALTTPGSGSVVALSMLPTIGGLAVLALPLPHAVAQLALAAGLGLAWLWDLRAADLPAGYKRLRAVLTAASALALVAGAAILQTGLAR